MEIYAEFLKLLNSPCVTISDSAYKIAQLSYAGFKFPSTVLISRHDGDTSKSPNEEFEIIQLLLTSKCAPLTENEVTSTFYTAENLRLGRQENT